MLIAVQTVTKAQRREHKRTLIVTYYNIIYYGLESFTDRTHVGLLFSDRSLHGVKNFPIQVLEL